MIKVFLLKSKGVYIFFYLLLRKNGALTSYFESVLYF